MIIQYLFQYSWRHNSIGTHACKYQLHIYQIYMQELLICIDKCICKFVSPTYIKYMSYDISMSMPHLLPLHKKYRYSLMFSGRQSTSNFPNCSHNVFLQLCLFLSHIAKGSDIAVGCCIFTFFIHSPYIEIISFPFYGIDFLNKLGQVPYKVSPSQFCLMACFWCH